MQSPAHYPQSGFVIASCALGTLQPRTGSSCSTFLFICRDLGEGTGDCSRAETLRGWGDRLLDARKDWFNWFFLL